RLATSTPTNPLAHVPNAALLGYGSGRFGMCDTIDRRCAYEPADFVAFRKRPKSRRRNDLSRQAIGLGDDRRRPHCDVRAARSVPQLDTIPKSPNEFGRADANIARSALAIVLRMAGRPPRAALASARANFKRPVGDTRIDDASPASKN